MEVEEEEVRTRPLHPLVTLAQPRIKQILAHRKARAMTEPSSHKHKVGLEQALATSATTPEPRVEPEEGKETPPLLAPPS